MHSCIPPPTCPFYEAGMPTPLTISCCCLALLPTEVSLTDGAESVLLQLRWINSPCTNLSTMRVPALRPRFQGCCESSPDLPISPVPRWNIALEPAILAIALGATRDFKIFFNTANRQQTCDKSGKNVTHEGVT